MNEAVIERRSGYAIASLVLSIVGIASYGLGAILGVVFGHIAKSKIKNQPNMYGGDGMATAGLIIGYIVIGSWIFITIIAGGFIAAMLSGMNM